MTWMSVIRFVLSIIVSAVVVMFLLSAVEFYSMIVHPFPEGFDGSMEQMCEQVARYPNWVLGTVVPMWGAIAFLGTWIAGLIGNRWSAGLIGTLLMAGVVFNVAMLPYVAWFKIVMPIVVLIAIILAMSLVSLRRPLPTISNE